MHAIIVGGGIGGLTTALAFEKKGWGVTVLEKAPSYDEIGAGIQISPNGLKVLQALDITPASTPLLYTKACYPEFLSMRAGRSGRPIFSVPLARAAQKRWRGDYIHIHRADLVATLGKTLSDRAPKALRFGASVVSYKNAGTRTEGPASVTLDDGTTLEADLVIAADGIHSTLRTQMLGPKAPRFTGNIAWRATVDTKKLGPYAPPPGACIWVGPKRHCVTYQLRGGSVTNFVGIVETDQWGSEAWTQKGSRGDALADFTGWHPSITSLIELADTHYRWALFDRPPLARWHDGRVALTGDACHPSLPFLAQGAVMAMEDAYAIAQFCARQPQNIEGALTTYYKFRIQRTAKAQRAATSNAALFHRRTLLAQIATYGPMWLAGKIFPAAIYARNHHFYNYDITKELF